MTHGIQGKSQGGVPCRDLITLLLSQDGDRYVFGVEVSATDADPDVFDCSEIVEWACARLGAAPRMPDGSWLQARHCAEHDLDVPVDRALRTRGALLFAFSRDPLVGSRPDRAHVAVSLGNGRTVEARSASQGVGVFSPRGGWTHGALIPGVEYPPWWLLTRGDRGEDVRNLQHVLDARGHGPVLVDGDYGPRTEQAVRQAQQRLGLVVNGIAGPDLLAELCT